MTNKSNDAQKGFNDTDGRTDLLNLEQTKELIHEILRRELLKKPMTFHHVVTFVLQTFKVKIEQNWIDSFLESHKNEIILTDAIPVDNERHNVDVEQLLKYADDMKLSLEDYHWQLVCSLVESSDHPKSFKKRKVFASKASEGKVLTYEMARPAGHFTFVWCYFADGHYFPPLIIVSRKKMDVDLKPFGMAFGDCGMIVTSSTGYINQSILSSYLEKIVIPAIDQKRNSLNLPKEPLLILHDMSPHLDTSVLDKHNVHTYQFPAHSSHLTQPLNGATLAACRRKQKKTWQSSIHLSSEMSKKFLNGVVSMESCMGRVSNMETFRSVGFGLDLEKQKLFFDVEMLMKRDGFPSIEGYEDNMEENVPTQGSDSDLMEVEIEEN